MERIALHLTSHGRGEEVPQKSGLNWGQRDVRQNKDEACLNCPEKYNGTFFPQEQKPFRVVTDDGVEFIMKVTGKPAKNLQVDGSLAPLGEYFRKRLKVRLGDPVTIDHLKAYGRLDVVFEKRDDYYFMDFSPTVNGGAGTDDENAWLVLLGGDYAGNDGYDDDVATSYSWDSVVGNSEKIREGDPIVLWDGKQLLGMSVIEEILTWDTTKIQRKCPSCNKAGFKERSTMVPRYKCDRKGCHAKFDEPLSIVKPVTAFRSRHGTWWTDLHGKLTGDQLRNLVLTSPSTQIAIRRLDWPAFLGALAEQAPELQHNITLEPLKLKSGFRDQIIRTRVGQPAFRAGLLEKFGNVCAFTGIQPEEVLEAAHLYSYAKIGEHKESGGLLLRRDIHSLFDRGLLGVDTTSQTLWVSEQLAMFDEYVSLDGASVFVDLNDKERHWLDLHTETYRTT